MLNKQFKLDLRKENDFFLNCKKVHTPYFSFFYLPSNNFQATVIVSKKVVLLATKRNEIKRKFRNALKFLLNDLIKFKIKLAIIVHPRGTKLSKSEIAEQIIKNVQKIRI